MGRRSGNEKVFVYEYKVLLEEVHGNKSKEHKLWEEVDGKRYVPINKIEEFAKMLKISQHLFGWLDKDIKTIDDLIRIKKNWLINFIQKVIDTNEIKTFSYSRIGGCIIDYLKNKGVSTEATYNTYYNKSENWYIVDILELFFGSEYKKDNKIKRLWLDSVIKDVNKRFLEIEHNDRGKRNQKMHRLTKILQSEYHCGCQLCKNGILEGTVLSHIKPVKRCYTKEENRDINNTLLLCRDHDTLFDHGYISFSDAGEIILSEKLSEEQTIRYGLDKYKRIELKKEQLPYMKYHRKYVFKDR